MPRRLLAKLLARLDASPLPMSDSVRLALEWELLDQIAPARPPTPSAFGGGTLALFVKRVDRQRFPSTSS